MDQTIDDTDRRRLLHLARRTLEARVRRQSQPPLQQGGALDLPRGAFVTIFHDGDLRGCLGRIEADWALGRTVRHLAGVVSDSDPRFPPVSEPELAGLDIEISVLTPERQIQSIDDIIVGQHGLIVEQGRSRGLLLPQVATGQSWDSETFAAYTSLKAGLPKDAWKLGARLFVFEAQVFGEKNSIG